MNIKVKGRKKKERREGKKEGRKEKEKKKERKREEMRDVSGDHLVKTCAPKEENKTKETKNNHKDCRRTNTFN